MKLQSERKNTLNEDINHFDYGLINQNPRLITGFETGTNFVENPGFVRYTETPSKWEYFDYERYWEESLKLQTINVENKVSINQAIKKIENITILESFKLLEDCWDGYSAPSLDFYLIEKCIDIIKLPFLKYQPDIFPTGRQSIQFEYEFENDRYLELEIFIDRIDKFYQDSKGSEIEEHNIEVEEAIAIINSFQD